MTKIFTCTLILFGILGCSHSNLHRLDDGIERVKITQEDYIQPDFYLEKEPSLETVSRMPASIQTDDFKHLSNRQLYFLSSYIHYNTYKKSLGIEGNTKSCPMFHSLILSEKKIIEKSYNLSMSADFIKVKNDNSLVTQYPVLALPYSERSDLYSELVSRDWKEPNKYLKSALSTHFENTEKEITQLCETGVSGGYYIYENLVTYFKTETSFHRTKEGLRALLKVPVIANMLIVDSLNSDYYSNTIDKYNNWLLSRSNTAWVKDYFKTLKSRRSEKLSRNSKP
jgi:hypothetical protein